MKVAVSICQNNVSNAFDFANNILLVEMEELAEKGRRDICLSQQMGPEKIAELKNLGVDVLICGAISRHMAYLLEAVQIQLIPFVTGNIEEILKAYTTNSLNAPQYTLPCCWWQGQRNCFRGGGRGRRGGGRQGNGRGPRNRNW